MTIDRQSEEYRISAALLARTAEAMLARDFPAFADGFWFPLTMTTISGRIEVATREDFEPSFLAISDHYRALGATGLPRTIEAVEFRNPDEIVSTQVHRVVAGTVDLVAPYWVISTLRRLDGKWRCSFVEYLLSDTSPQGRAFLASRTNDPEATAIYQQHLDVLSRAILAADFDSFALRISLPHKITTETDTIEMTTPEELERAFRSFSDLYIQQGVTDFVRIVTSAHFRGPDEIIGTHESHKLRNGLRVQAPYPNRIRLLRGADRQWRETHCANAIMNSTENFHTWTKLAETPQLPDLALDPERTKT